MWALDARREADLSGSAAKRKYQVSHSNERKVFSSKDGRIIRQYVE